MTRTSPADRQDESELVTGVLGIYIQERRTLGDIRCERQQTRDGD
jgi:hypothetical protein